MFRLNVSETWNRKSRDAVTAPGSSCVLSVVVMAYNEVETIDATCAEIQSVLEELNLSYEILIVDDGSTDGTATRADLIVGRERGVRAIHHERNQGLGGVYRTGFREAHGKYVTFFPADGQFPARIIASFLPRMDHYEMVLGFLPAGGRTIIAETLSAAERLVYRLLLGPIPRFQGIVMFQRELLACHQLHSEGRGWAILMEFIVRCSRANHRIISLPTEVRARTHGASKVNNLRTISSNLRQIVMLRRVLMYRSPS
jgi:glycosyltransferase involved in cell wall biosynthesis